MKRFRFLLPAVVGVLATLCHVEPAQAQDLNEPRAKLTEVDSSQYGVLAIQTPGTNGVGQIVMIPWADMVSLMGAGGGGDLTDANFGSATASTLVSGAFTRTTTVHVIDHEGVGPDDILTTINGGSEGDLIIIAAAADADLIVDNGGGNIDLGVQGDGRLDADGEWMALRHDGAEWELLYASPNTQTVDISMDAALAEGSASTLATITGINAGAVITEFDPVYLDPTDEEWKLAEADSTIVVGNAWGIAATAGTDGNPLEVIVRGIVHDSSGFNFTVPDDIGKLVYVSTTGALTLTPPSGAGEFVKVVGRVMADRKMYVDVSSEILQNP